VSRTTEYPSRTAERSAAIWEIQPLAELMESAKKSLAGRELSETERRKYFLD